MDYILNRLWQNKCLYCKQELNKEAWHSTWGEGHEHHYKAIDCQKCKRTNWAKIHFPGTGHDGLFKQEMSPLESTIKKVWDK